MPVWYRKFARNCSEIESLQSDDASDHQITHWDRPNPWNGEDFGSSRDARFNDKSHVHSSFLVSFDHSTNVQRHLGESIQWKTIRINRSLRVSNLPSHVKHQIGSKSVYSNARKIVKRTCDSKFGLIEY
jgi:hypothetical protein